MYSPISDYSFKVEINRVVGTFLLSQCCLVPPEKMKPEILFTRIEGQGSEWIKASYLQSKHPINKNEVNSFQDRDNLNIFD